MKCPALLLAAMALPVLTAPILGPATAAPATKAVKKTTKKAAPKAKTPPPDFTPLMATDAARVAQWVARARDNRGLPYVIIDKPMAIAFLYDAQGRAVAHAPVLVGIAPGDDASPGIGAKSLAEIGPAEKTTPAGRFLAKFGVAAGRQRVLWVDYATSVALHTIPPGNPKEQRRERMLSPAIDDNRITFGCINVPKQFYSQGLSPLFARKGGYVYILPDSKPLEEVFPPIRVEPFLTAPPAAPTAG